MELNYELQIVCTKWLRGRGVERIDFGKRRREGRGWGKRNKMRGSREDRFLKKEGGEGVEKEGIKGGGREGMERERWERGRGEGGEG